MDADHTQDILIAPRTTAYALLTAYPFLEGFLRERVPGFERLADDRARTRWARIMTVEDVALRLNLPWRHLVRIIAEQVEQETGRSPRMVDAPRRIIDDERRVGELRDIVADLEGGWSLDDLAARWRLATADLEEAEADALEAALSRETTEERERTSASMVEPSAAAAPPPPGHPLDLLRREAQLIRRECEGLAAELRLLGGSPGRRRWCDEYPAVAHYAAGLASVELRIRREQQAWFPALAVYGVEGPQALLAPRQRETLEMLRRLRMALESDDAASTADAGSRLLQAVDELLAQDERVLEPLAERHFSAADWAAVREVEEGVGWGLASAPPAWP